MPNCYPSRYHTPTGMAITAPNRASVVTAHPSLTALLAPFGARKADYRARRWWSRRSLAALPGTPLSRTAEGHSEALSCSLSHVAHQYLTMIS